jgi:hypothetical protein
MCRNGMSRYGTSRAEALEISNVKNSCKIVRLLLEYGADIDFPGAEWVHTLGAGKWSVQIVQQVLENHVPLSVYALVSAMFDTDLQAEAVLSVMLPYLTSEIAVERNEYLGNSLFFLAVAHGSVAATQRCFDLGVDINAQDHDGKTALHHSVENEQLAIVKMVLRAGIDNLGVDVNVRDAKGKIALHYAAVLGQLAIVEMLVWAGSDINTLDFRGNTPIQGVKNDIRWRESRMSQEELDYLISHHEIIRFLVERA